MLRVLIPFLLLGSALSTVSLTTLTPSTVFAEFMTSRSESQVSHPAPRLVTHPANRTVPLHSPLSFTCRTDPALPPPYLLQITRDHPPRGVLLTREPSRYIILAANHASRVLTHTISNATSGDSGWYNCTVKSRDGQVKHVARWSLHVEDICESVTCPKNEKSVADYVSGRCTCICVNQCRGRPSLRMFNIICGSDCRNYYSWCHFNNVQCQKKQEGLSLSVFRQGYCPALIRPKIDLARTSQAARLRRGDTHVQVTCTIISSQHVQVTWNVALSTRDEESERPTTTGSRGTSHESVTTSTSRITTTSTLTLPSGSLPKSVTCVAEMCGYVMRSNIKLLSDHGTLPPFPPHFLSSRGSRCAVSHRATLRTFDRLTYHVTTSGNFVLALDKTNFSWFVYGNFQPCTLPRNNDHRNDMATSIPCLSSVTVYDRTHGLSVYDNFFVLGRDLWERIRLNETITHHGILVTRTGDTLAVIYIRGSGMSVSWDGRAAVVTVDNEGVAAAGLCGSNDGNKGNDMLARRGKPGSKTTVEAFVESWRVGQGKAMGEEVRDAGRRKYEEEVKCDNLVRDLGITANSEFYVGVCRREVELGLGTEDQIVVSIRYEVSRMRKLLSKTSGISEP